MDEKEVLAVALCGAASHHGSTRNTEALAQARHGKLYDCEGATARMVTDESVAEFISLTSASDDEAKGYLEMAGGNLQQALGLFFEMGGGSSSPALGPSPSPAAPAAPAANQPVIDADVAAEVAAAAAAAGIDTGPLQDAHMAGEEEVRAPMPAYQDQIINPDLEHRRMQEQMAADSAAMFRRMSFDRGGDPAGAGSGTGEEQEDEQMGEGKAINKLFAPPEYNEGSSYYETIEKAKGEGKWVLVNIQQAEVFASHTLNRDVWSDDTIKDIITGSFLFWQRDDKSAEGDQFCHYHQCGHQLPHICVIDPRTGRRVKVGLDQLKHKLSAVKSRVQTVQAKSAHDAIGAALLKVREQETSAESLPPDSGSPAPNLGLSEGLQEHRTHAESRCLSSFLPGAGLVPSPDKAVHGFASGTSSVAPSLWPESADAAQSAMPAKPSLLAAVVPQSAPSASNSVPSLPLGTPQASILEVPHAAPSGDGQGQGFQQAPGAFAEDPALNGSALSIQQQMLYIKQYQQLLVNGYDGTSATSAPSCPSLASSLPGFQSSTVDAGNALAELNSLEERVREAEDKVKRAAAQSHHYVGFISKFDTLKGYGFVSCSETFKRFGRDIFIDRESYQGARIGDTVVFSVGFNKKGEVRACDVQKLNEVTRLKQELQQKKQAYMTSVSRSGMNVQSALELIQGKSLHLRFVCSTSSLAVAPS
ncbi:Ubxn7 [Symbiodinium sp. KB8]|nr:Ubxn7 [Symbiodinium sp. KB8]